MALLFLKSLVLPHRSTKQPYTLLPHNKSASSFGDTASGCATASSTDSEKGGDDADTIVSGTSMSSRSIDPRLISDATIGLSDGLTVPFALTAGLSALGDTKVVIYGGLAELIAGGISMGLGGYLGARGEA